MDSQTATVATAMSQVTLDHEQVLSDRKIQFGHEMRDLFLFEPGWNNVNHGSFGTYPKSVRDVRRKYQDLTEAAPDRFIRWQYAPLLNDSRARVARLINADVDEVVFIPNATTGTNVILRNLTYEEKDTIIYFETVYGALAKTLLSVQEINPHLTLRKVEYKLPCTYAHILNAFSQTISRLLYDGFKPRVAVFDTINSIPGARFPFERVTKVCREYGILSVIDGAHGIGHIPLDMKQLDPDFFVSNCHKWLFTPRGCAAFYVAKRNQQLIRTALPTSHGYKPRTNEAVREHLEPKIKTYFENLFEYVGTADETAYYCLEEAMKFRDVTCGGEQAIYSYIRDIGQRGADEIAKILGTRVMDDADPASLSNTGSPVDGRSIYATGGLRDCALATVLLPIKIEGAHIEATMIESSREPDINHVTMTDQSSAQHGDAREASQRTDGFVTIRKEDVKSHVKWLWSKLTYEFHTSLIVFEYNGQLWGRVSGQVYLELSDFERAGHVLKTLCQRIAQGEVFAHQEQSK